jgi:hypothetical protein
VCSPARHRLCPILPRIAPPGRTRQPKWAATSSPSRHVPVPTPRASTPDRSATRRRTGGSLVPQRRLICVRSSGDGLHSWPLAGWAVGYDAGLLAEFRNGRIDYLVVGSGGNHRPASCRLPATPRSFRWEACSEAGPFRGRGA